MLAHIVSDIQDCTLETYLDPTEAITRCREVQFDLVLVDYLMPQMTGVDLLHTLRVLETYAMVPVIIVTSDDDRAIRMEAIAAGATDFINKPFDKTELRARVTNLLTLRRSQIKLADRATWLASEVEAATRHMLEREEEVIWRLARAMEYRDGGTSEHVSRVAIVCKLIAEGIGLSPERCRIIYLAAPLHDIGKIGISDTILGKPGRLDAVETAQMRQHVSIGASILEGGTSDLVRTAAVIAQSHHEKWDGSGYPAGLAVQAIEANMRLVSLNAAVKCAQLGPRGRALDVIAHLLRELTGETVVSAQAALASLDTAAKMAERVSAAALGNAAGQVGKLEEEARLSVALLEAVDKRLTDALALLERDGPDAVSLLGEAADGFAIQGEIGETLSDIRFGIEALACPDSGNPEHEPLTAMLVQIPRTYTMESERRLRMFPPSAASAEPEPASGCG
jgi:putative two-component system response regulator